MLEIEITGDRNNFFDLQKNLFGNTMQSNAIKWS